MQSNIRQYIDFIISFYTSQSITNLDPFTARKRSGTVQHHLRSVGFKESVVPNTLSNVYQQVTGSSNSHRILTQSGSHFLMNFLHCHCWTTHALTEALDGRITAGEYWSITRLRTANFVQHHLLMREQIWTFHFFLM